MYRKKFIEKEQRFTERYIVFDIANMQILCYVKIAVQTTFGCDANGKKTSVTLGRKKKCAL